MDDSAAGREASSEHEAGPRSQGADREAPQDHEDHHKDVDPPLNKYRQTKSAVFA